MSLQNDIAEVLVSEEAIQAKVADGRLQAEDALVAAHFDVAAAVEAGANILVVVLNDSRYGMINAIQQRQFQRPFGDEIGAINFARFAESFGATGIRVESPEALPDGVASALAMSAQTPVLLDVVCDYRYPWPDQEAILAAGLAQGSGTRSDKE